MTWIWSLFCLQMSSHIKIHSIISQILRSLSEMIYCHQSAEIIPQYCFEDSETSLSIVSDEDYSDMVLYNNFIRYFFLALFDLSDMNIIIYLTNSSVIFRKSLHFALPSHSLVELKNTHCCALCSKPWYIHTAGIQLAGRQALQFMLMQQCCKSLNLSQLPSATSAAPASHWSRGRRPSVPIGRRELCAEDTNK